MKQFLSVLLLAVLFAGFINAQGKIALGVQGGVALPIGDMEKAYELGFGGQANFAYHISPMIDIMGSIGYFTWSGKTQELPNVLGTGTVTSEGGKLSSVPVFAGIRYYFGKGKFNPYVTGELGLHFETIEVPTNVIIVNGSTTGSDLGYGVGAGFLYQLGPKLDLDVNAKYSAIARESATLSYINILAGVLLAL
jgi:opacity protein-like surface antigen